MTLPVTVPFWLCALCPILFLFLSLTAGKIRASRAAPCALLFTLILVLLFFRLPLFAAVTEAGKGLWNAIVIIGVVLPAISLYELSDKAGAYQAICAGFQQHCNHQLLQIMFFGWLIPSFMQGITGYGVAVAIGAPLLISIGVTPLWSVALVLLCHAWGATFGTLSLAWQVLLSATGLTGQTAASAACWAGLFLWMYNLAAGLLLCIIYGGRKALKEGLWAVLLFSAIQGGGELLLVNINDAVACFLPSCVAVAAALLLAKTKRYRCGWQMKSRIMSTKTEAQAAETEAITFRQACLPYFLLTFFAVFCLFIPPVNAALSRWQLGFSFPGSITGYGYKTAAEPFYAPIAPLTYAGTLLSAAALVTYVYYRRKNLVPRGVWSDLMRRTASKVIPSSISTCCLIVMAKIMGASGMIHVLATGAAHCLGQFYILLAPFIGLVGSFVTGSNMSSNILFSGFQQATAHALGISESLILGMQTTGGAMGISITPSNVVLGTATVGMSGQEGEIIRRIVVIPLFIALIVGVIGLVLAL